MAVPGTPRTVPVCFVESYASDGRVTVKLVGELDAAARPAIEAKLHRLTDSADTTVDLAKATVRDLGSGRMLVDCRERAQRNERSIEIDNPPEKVAQLLGDREIGPRTTVDAERSRPDSQQIVRLQCPVCGNQTFRSEVSASRDCEQCGSALEVVAIFRDRRRLERPVELDRR